MIVGADIQVGRFDVAVQETLLVNRLQRRQHVFEQAAHLVLAQDFTVLQDRAQRFAFLIIHDDVGCAMSAEIALHPHHERMLDPSQHSRLVKKAFQPPDIVRRLIRIVTRLALGIRVNRDAVGIAERPLHRKVFLDGDPVFQMGVQRFVRHAKAACTQNGVNPVFVQHAAGWQGIGATRAALGRRGRIRGGHHDGASVAGRHQPRNKLH